MSGGWLRIDVVASLHNLEHRVKGHLLHFSMLPDQILNHLGFFVHLFPVRQQQHDYKSALTALTLHPAHTNCRWQLSSDLVPLACVNCVIFPRIVSWRTKILDVGFEFEWLKSLPSCFRKPKNLMAAWSFDITSWSNGSPHATAKQNVARTLTSTILDIIADCILCLLFHFGVESFKNDAKISTFKWIEKDVMHDITAGAQLFLLRQRGFTAY